MTTKSFEQFRAELADAVTVAINTGTRISDMADDVDCRCPLGVRSVHMHPKPVVAARAWGITPGQAAAFIEAFDWAEDNGTRFAKLGLLYRSRFIGGE